MDPIEKCSQVTSESDIIYKYTPESQIADNYRQVAGLIKIDLQDNTLNFNGKISLSGQYSTLLRNFYQYNLIDPTINALYKTRMSDKAEKNTVN